MLLQKQHNRLTGILMRLTIYPIVIVPDVAPLPL